MFALALVSVVTPSVQERVDPLTDEKSVYAIFADNSTNMAVGCAREGDRKSVRVAINLGRYVGTATAGIIAGGREVVYRFDKRPSQISYWHSQDRSVFTEADRASPVAFMLELRSSTSFFLRTIDPVGNPVEVAYTYAIPAFEVDAVLRRCGLDRDGKKLKN